jgi:hypothetical protein
VKTNNDLFPDYRNYQSEITLNESWNASMLRDNVWVRLWSDDEGSNNLYVDYVGVYYFWLCGEDSEEEPSEDAVIWGFGINSALGLTGFIGVIGVPPLAVWVWRHEGGSKIKAFILMTVSFMVCLTLFMSSIMGIG